MKLISPSTTSITPYVYESVTSYLLYTGVCPMCVNVFIALTQNLRVEVFPLLLRFKQYTIYVILLLNRAKDAFDVLC